MDFDTIIVSHNHGKYLKDCLLSITYSLKTNLILIINNPKDKESIKIVQKFSKIKILINKKPKGLAANLNQAIKISKNKFILILNPDTVVIKGAIDKLVYFMKKKPKVGIVGPKLVYPDGKLQFSARRFPTWKTFFVRRTPLRWFLKESKENNYHLGGDLDHSKTQPVDWLLGACVLIRRRTIEDVGLFDEKYYLYVEDIDYCYRAWKRGWEVWYVPNSVIIHHHRAESDKKLISLASYLHTKSMVRYYLKNILKIIK